MAHEKVGADAFVRAQLPELVEGPDSLGEGKCIGFCLEGVVVRAAAAEVFDVRDFNFLRLLLLFSAV